MTPLAPRYALVSAIYNVARYLPDFLASLDAQQFDKSRVKIVLVDDGSTDNSAALCIAWASSTEYEVQVLRKQNGGQASARNYGLESLTDIEWVTFTDPDDTLAPDYFAEIDQFIANAHELTMCVANLYDHYDATGEIANRHPLNFRFKGGNQVVDLTRFPEFFHLSAATAFFRLSTLKTAQINFSTRVRPNFEDGHLIARFLLAQKQQQIGFVQSAKYFYRRRADGSSTLQQSVTDPRRYTDVIQYGYLPLLKSSVETAPGKFAAEWLQNLVVYELLWVFRSDDSLNGKTGSLTSETTDRFHELVRECRKYISTNLILSYSLVRVTYAQRLALCYGYVSAPWVGDVRIMAKDPHQRLVKVAFHFTGPAPEVAYFVRGVEITPRHQKYRSYRYLGKSVVKEKIAWVPAHGTLRVHVEGEPAPLRYGYPAVSPIAQRPAQIDRRLGVRKDLPPRRRMRKVVRPLRPSLKERIAAVVSRTFIARKIFGRSWILLDRDTNANDNAEHLFRYLRKERRDINAWFAVRKDARDFARLRAEGFRRILPYGSFMWQIACLNATHIVSSHADAFVYNPFKRPGGWDWKFIFLQHGITKDDLSRWLNPKPISGLITATKAEYESFVEDGSQYVATTKEVALTGFPRFDKLHELRELNVSRKKHLLFMPTWRRYLVTDKDPQTGLRQKAISLRESDFGSHWLEVLEDQSLHTLAREMEFDVAVMLHPNLEPHINDFSAVSGIKVYSFADADVQEMIASSALVITDYSSIAFDAAAVNVPVAYFQFDSAAFFAGNHTLRKGYFDYYKDGFGPVASTASELLRRIAELLNTDDEGYSVYQQKRVDSFFGEPGTACEKVTRFIESLEQPLSFKEASTAFSHDQ